MHRIAFSRGPGLWHEVKVGMATSSAQSALLKHRLLKADAPGSALASEWVEDCDPIDCFFPFVVTECPFALLERVDPAVKGDSHVAKISDALDGSDADFDEDGVIIYKE